MGFGLEARRVRDVSTPLDHRFHAFKYCIEYESPLGYEGTFAYLEAATGFRREEPAFLEVALDLVERERRARQEVETRYAAVRRSLKCAGMRSPHPDAITPWHPPRWHGDERTGAQYALATWLDRRVSEDLLTHAEAAKAVAAARVAVNNRVPELDLDSLQRGLDWARKEIEVGYRPERSDYGAAWTTLFVLGQIHVLLDGQLAVGTTWRFVPQARQRSRRTSTAHAILSRAVGLWRTAGPAGTRAVIDASTDLLVLGYDTPALRELAGLTAQDSYYEVEPVLVRALDQLEVNGLLDGSAERAGLTARLEQFLDGELSLRELSTWAHHVIGHEGDDDLQPFVMLDDIYDDWEYAGLDLPYLDQVTRKAARDFLAGRRVTRLDWLEPPAQEAAQSATVRRPSWRARLRRRGR